MNLQEIYNKLELTEDKGCLIRMSDNDWEKKVNFPSRISRLLKKNNSLKALDAFFCFDNKPLILFFDNPTDEKILHQAIWNFNESPIVIIVKNNEVEIFNGFAIDENKERLQKLGDDGILTDFSYFELVTGRTWAKYKKEIDHKNRVDYRLLENIEAAQILLKKQKLSQTTANALLGKIIFFRYLIDRKVRLNYEGKGVWSNEDLCECLQDINQFKTFIRHIEDKNTGFNGDMFHIDEKEFDTINQCSLNIIVRLLQSVELSTGQQSLFNMYDFSILPIEFISNMYEKFIGKKNQEKKSAYYTPTFLVDYIVSETVGKKLKDSDSYNCKVLDPACGSGIFLVESLRRIIEKYIQTHNITNTNTEEFRQVLKQIALDNIFGIDEDYSAIQVAIFSVYLTLLDYQEPADIGNFKFPNLMGTNFICSDTFNLDNDDLKAFEEKKITFDYIIGNPPWKRGGVEKGSHCEKYLKQKGYLDKVGNRELAQAFVFRSLDFTYPNTQCALVLVSKVLYNATSKDFRTFILDNLLIKQVFELASVRKEVFNRSNDTAIAPSCVLFYKNANGKSTDKNVILHIALKTSRFFSLFKIFSLTRNDIQQVQQDRLKIYDWLWKVLVYGSYLDFIFIKRLKEYATLSNVIETNNFIVKQGVKEKDKNKKIDVSSLVGLNYIKTKNVKKYHISDKDEKWKLSEVGYIYRNKERQIVTDLYKAPMLLITGGTSNDLHTVSAISYIDGIFKSSLTAVKGDGDDVIPILRNIQGVLNSSFFAYYNLLTFSSSGIEREETHDEEKLSVPYCKELNAKVETVEKMYEEFYNSVMDDSQKERKIESQLECIDELIYTQFKCSDIEKDLIDYALNISIPLAVKFKGFQSIFYEIQESNPILKEYAHIYINRFSDSFNRNGKRFVVEILHSNQIIGMFFKIIDECDFKGEIVFSSNNDVLLSAMARLSSERITDNLFVQKDVRGFEKDYFYIFKPNEKRLWHKAIAHLDVNEFADAMLRVGGSDNE